MGTSTVKKSTYNLWMIIFAVLTLVGVVCWVLQLTKGLQLTNLSETNMWGLYITFFMIFTGIAAGCLFFAAVPYLFNLTEFKHYSRLTAYIGAICSIVAASLFIIVDIGNPERAWLFITSGNFSSPMYWDFLILASYMILSVIFTRQLILVHNGEKEEKTIKPIAIISFIAGLMVMVTSFVFAFQVARPIWNNPVQPISFLLSAFAIALAILMLVGFILRRVGYIHIQTELLAKMGKVIAILLTAELIIIAVENLIGLYPGSTGEAASHIWLLTGDGAFGFWLEIIAIVAAILLFSGKGKSVLRLVSGAIATLIAIYLIKTNLLQAELFNPLISLPGPELYGAQTGPYFPSLLEIGLSVGIISLGALLLGLGLKVLHLGSQKLVEGKKVSSQHL